MQDLAHFYHRIGQPAYQLAGGVWVAETRLSLMSVPGILPLRPECQDVHDLLRKSGRVAAVFSCGHETGRTVQASVVRDRDYGLHSLQRQFRQQVKLAQRDCTCRPLTWKEAASLALPVNQDALARRGIGRAWFTEAADWAAYCEAAADLPGYEITGCFVGHDLAAYMITWLHEGICYGLQMLWTARFQDRHPTHALYYHVVRACMARPDIQRITVGRQSVPAMTRVDRFKAHAGFVKEPCRVGIVLRPGVSALMTHPWSLGMMRAMRRRAGGHWPKLQHTEVFEVAAETRLP